MAGGCQHSSGEGAWHVDHQPCRALQAAVWSPEAEQELVNPPPPFPGTFVLPSPSAPKCDGRNWCGKVGDVKVEPFEHSSGPLSGVRAGRLPSYLVDLRLGLD